jgi:thiol:disulfide interchange protein
MKALIKTQLTPFFKPILGLFIAFHLSVPLQAQAGEVLPLAVDLQKIGQVAEKNQVPVVIFATATWCNYCKKLEENILTPLLETTPIEEYAQFQQILLDKAHWMMKDFAGNDVEMKVYGPQLGVQVAPTTLFFNSRGEQIAEPIIGLTLEEHYPANLEKRINQALEALGNPKRLDIYKLVEESQGL